MLRNLCLIALLTLLIAPQFAKADGGLIFPKNYWGYETGQKGAIVYQDGVETLVLQTSYQGKANDFAWIIPTPSKPDVTKVSSDLFDNLNDLTQPKNIIYPMTTANFANDSAGPSEGVKVIEQKQVGIYEINVLSATDKNSLYDWLNQNGYIYPSTKKYILDEYITNKWFFTAIKISKDAITNQVQDQLSQGDLSPIKFVFKTSNIVYPLKISQVVEDQNISSDVSSYYPSSVPITLYVFADHKKELSSGYTTTFANWIKGDEIEKLAKDDNGNSWVTVKNKLFLTKITNNILVSSMTSDLFFDNAKNNSKVGVDSWYDELSSFMDSFGGIILLLSLLIFLAVSIFQFNQIYKKHLALWIVQWLCFVAILLVYLVNIINTTLPNKFSYQANMFFESPMNIISYLSLPILILLVMKLQQNMQKNR
jgi:hypothetical protein